MPSNPADSARPDGCAGRERVQRLNDVSHRRPAADVRRLFVGDPLLLVRCYSSETRCYSSETRCYSETRSERPDPFE